MMIGFVPGLDRGQRFAGAAGQVHLITDHEELWTNSGVAWMNRWSGGGTTPRSRVGDGADFTVSPRSAVAWKVEGHDGDLRWVSPRSVG